MTDCTLGLVIVFVVLRISEHCFGYTSGLYSARLDAESASDVDCWRWARQILVYLAIVSLKKLCVVALLWACLPFSMSAGMWAISWTRDPHWQLVFVMVLTPLIMDTFSFWVTDNFLKYVSPEEVHARDLVWCRHAGVDVGQNLLTTQDRLG